MALPAAAATSSVGRGASADDVHELQEHLHTSAADQHADQADEGGLGHNQRLGEAGAARDEGAAARGVEQPRFGARGGAQAAVVQVACFCGQQPLEWASDALEPSLRRVELRGDDTSAAGGAAPRRAAARVEGGAEGVNLARGEELLGARRAARSTGEVDALGRAFDSPQGVRASAAAAMAISPPGPQDSPSLSLSPLVAAAVTDGDEGLGRCDSPLGDEHLVSGRAATPPPGGLKTPGSEGARIDDERAAARAVGTLSPAPGPIAPRPYTRAVARGAVETERRAARHSADAQLDSMAFSQHGSSAACVSSRTRGHTGVDSSIGSTGSKHYEGGSVALPSARGIVMNNVGDVHARAVAPVGMSVGVEPSAAGAALPAPQDMPAPASPLRPSHERGCKCGECNDWRRLRWQRRAAQPVPVLPVERFAHEGGLVTKNDAALVRLQHARRLMGARDPLLWGTIPFAELGVPLEARTTLHDVEALIEARQLQLDGAGQAGVQRGPTGKRLRGMGDAQARAGDSMSAMSAAAPSDVSRRVRFALASDGPLPGHVMADVSVVTAHELSLVRAERAGEAASSASSAGTAHVVTGSSTRVALRQAAFAAGRKRLAERAVTGVDAELGMGVRVTWQAVARHAGADVADEGALQRVGFACIQGLHEGEAGNVVAHLRYVEDGDVWVDTAQHFAPGDREGALEAYQCARREGRPRKHMVPLSELTRGGLAVGASARTAATLGYGRAPEWLTRDAVAALDGDGIGLGARRFASAFACALRGHAVKAAGLSSRDDPPDWRARLSDAPSVGADAGQQPFRLQSASEPGMASCAPAPKGLEWAMWLCAQLADASLLNDLVALGDDIQHVRVMPWGLLYEAAAHACRLDVIEELVPALSLGGCWRSSTDVMLDQAYIGDVRWLPAHGKRLRDRGICTLPEVAAWLSVNAEDVLSRKQAAWRAGRLRRLDSYARPPEALGSALLRVFIRSRETEDSAVGMCIEDAAGGDAFRVCVTAEQVALMLPDVNRGFIGELLKLQVSRRIAGRGLFLLVAATDGAHAKAVERSSLTALQGGADPVSLLPRVGCGAYFGQQLLASACPLGVGRSLPPWYDNNLAELYGLILAQRQHLALLVGISVGQVARRLAHDCEFGIGVADDAGVAARPLYEGVGLRSLDLLVSIDSEMIAKLVDRAWEQNDLGRLRGETYGLRLEESLLMRRWAKRCGAELVLLRLSSHVGFVHNEMADAIATVASARYGVCEPPLIVRRTLAFITCVGGLASPWHAGATGERSGAEFDGKTSLRVRVYSHGVYLRRLIAEQVKVYTATRGTGDDYVAGLAEATGLRLHERFSRGEELCSLRELLVREVIIHVDGTACAELIEGRHFASPIYDYEFAGRDVTNGHRRYDRRIQKALATQRMGGAGNSTQLSRVGMRQIFRNFEQVVLPGLGSSAQRDADQPAWDALPRRTCPACGRKARCDVFHFFECDNGLTDDVSVAVARALSAQALLLHPAGADAEMGDSDTHVELAWAQAAVLCRRQNGELGRYRRFLAAKVFGGAFAPPAHDSIEATAREWAINVPPADVDEAERLSDEEDEEGSVSAERSRLAKFKRRVLRYYVHKVVALNTMIIDHLRGPYGVWLRTMLEGDAGLKRLFGGDHELVAGVDDARLCEEHLDGVFRSRGDEQERLMTRAEFVHERDEGLLPPGEFTQTIAGETLKLSVAAEGDAAARRARREARKVQQLEVVEQGKFKYARPECERELGIILERRIKLGYRNLDVPTAEEAAILRDGGRARALELMTAASEIGRCAWYDGDGGGDGGDGGDMARESEGWLGGRSRPHHHELGSHVVMAGEAPPVLEREAEPRGVTPPPCQYAEEGERGGERGETVVERSVAESGDGVVDRGGVHDDGYGDADMDMSMDMGFDESVGESMAEASGWGPEAVAEGRDLGMVAEDGVSAAGIGMGGTADGVLEGIPARSMGVFAGSSSAAAASEAGGGDAAAASEVAAAGGVTGVKRACGVVSGGEAGERGEERKRKKKKAPGAGRVGRQVGMTRSRRDAVKRASSAPPRADGGQS